MPIAGGAARGRRTDRAASARARAPRPSPPRSRAGRSPRARSDASARTRLPPPSPAFAPRQPVTMTLPFSASASPIVSRLSLHRVVDEAAGVDDHQVGAGEGLRGGVALGARAGSGSARNRSAPSGSRARRSRSSARRLAMRGESSAVHRSCAPIFADRERPGFSAWRGGASRAGGADWLDGEDLATVGRPSTAYAGEPDEHRRS